MEQIESKGSIIAAYYTEHYDELKSFVASRLLSAGEAEDIVQTVFVRILQSDKMITPVTLPCLVYTVARNLISDYWRHKHYVDEYEHIIQKGGWMNGSVDDVESVYSAKEVERLLERGMARLTQRQCRVYLLNLYEGLKVGDIAQRLNIKYKNAEYCLGVARKEMRCYMKKVLAS